MSKLNRRRFLRKSTATITASTVVATAATSQVTAQSTHEFEEDVEQEIHDRINTIRTERGLQALGYSETLEQVADYHSQDMIDENYFAHTAPDGETVGDRYDKYGISCQAWGENILYNYASDKSPANAAETSVEQWMESDAHRHNILSEMWTIEGTGAQVGSDGRLYVTQNFGAGCQ